MSQSLREVSKQNFTCRQEGKIDSDEIQTGALQRIADALVAVAPSGTDTMANQSWQPIKTAPQTGQTLLLGYFNKCDKWRTVRGQYFSQERIDDEWEEPDLGGPGWYEVAENAEDPPNCWAIEPTQWMPLPEPPQHSAV